MKRIWEFSIEMFVSLKGGENLSGQNIRLIFSLGGRKVKGRKLEGAESRGPVQVGVPNKF